MALDLDNPDVCECVRIEQDESCPVGYPSLLCEDCDGVGYKSAKGWLKNILGIEWPHRKEQS